MRWAAAAFLITAVVLGALSIARNLSREPPRSSKHVVFTPQRLLPRVRDFVSFLQRVIPRNADVRILSPGGDCPASSPNDRYWVAYRLLPRVATCDAATPYWIYVGTEPIGELTPPAGWVVVRFAPRLTLAHPAEVAG